MHAMYASSHLTPPAAPRPFFLKRIDSIAASDRSYMVEHGGGGGGVRYVRGEL